MPRLAQLWRITRELDNDDESTASSERAQSPPLLRPISSRRLSPVPLPQTLPPAPPAPRPQTPSPSASPAPVDAATPTTSGDPPKKLGKERKRRDTPPPDRPPPYAGVCWNCWAFEHEYTKCPERLRRFCRGCGYTDRTLANCPKCAEKYSTDRGEEEKWIV